MDELEALQAQQAVYSEFRTSPTDIKPCAAYILHHNPKSRISNPNDHAFFIAVELKRIGKKKEGTGRILQIWNSRNSWTLKLSELNRLIDRVYSHSYDFGCNGSMAREYCPEKENCTYYKGLFARKGRHRERDFYKYGWQHVLKNYEICLYKGLIELEKRKRLKPGSLIIAPYRPIHQASGVDTGVITKGLSRLEKLGLIWCQIGQPFRWQEKATEIRRIVPISRPKNNAKMHTL